jgi:hypothetical protein
MDSKLIDKLLFYGFLGLVLYLLYQKFSGSLKAALAPDTATATAGGSALQKLLNPSAANYSGGTTYTGVVFPDGSSHAVDPAWVNPDNSFVWPPPTGDGQTYILAIGASGAKAAYLASSVVDSTAPDFTAPGVAGLGVYRQQRRRRA